MKEEKETKRLVWTLMLVSPQSLRTGNLALQHVTHSHPHGFMADTLVVVLTVPWVALLRERPTHRWPLNTFYLNVGENSVNIQTGGV